jgi:hypothetical protein
MCLRLKGPIMRRVAMLATALVLSASSSSQAACRFDFARLYFGFETPMNGEADSGKPCGFVLTTSLSAGAHSYRIAQAPNHGAAAVGYNSGTPVVAYRSAAGYRGPDTFVVSFIGGNARVPDEASSIDVHLDVR